MALLPDVIVDAYEMSLRGATFTMVARRVPYHECEIPDVAVDKILAGHTVLVARHEAMDVCRDLDAIWHHAERQRTRMRDSGWNPSKCGGG